MNADEFNGLLIIAWIIIAITLIYHYEQGENND